MKQGLRLVICVIIFAGFAARADIFRWVDRETGTVIYSDQPGKNARRVKLRGTSQSVNRRIPATRTADSEKKPPVYKSVSIISPANNTTVRDKTGNVPVSLGIKPALRKGDRIILDFDEQKFNLDSTRFIIKSVPAGNHKLLVSVLDKDGKVLIKSKLSRFMLKRSTATTAKQ